MYIRVCVCAWIDLKRCIRIETTEGERKIMYMYKQIQKKGRSTQIFLLSFLLFLLALSLLSIEFVDSEREEDNDDDDERETHKSKLN